MPSRAKLVKIPVDDEVDYETAAASDLRYDKENDMSTSSTILSNDNSQSSNDLMNNGLILSTSRYKFPRKNSGLNSAQNQQKLQQSQMIPQSPPPPLTPPLPPPPPLPPVYPSSISPAKTCTINGMKPSLNPCFVFFLILLFTINFVIYKFVIFLDLSEFDFCMIVLNN